jgi:hypothetical protein
MVIGRFDPSSLVVVVELVLLVLLAACKSMHTGIDVSASVPINTPTACNASMDLSCWERMDVVTEQETAPNMRRTARVEGEIPGMVCPVTTKFRPERPVRIMYARIQSWTMESGIFPLEKVMAQWIV